LINKTLAQMNAERAAGPARQKKIKSKHNNLLNYFIHDRRDLSPAYVRSCEKFFRELGKKRNKFKASSNATRHNLFTEIEKNKKNKSASSRVGPPNKVKGTKQG